MNKILELGKKLEKIKRIAIKNGCTPKWDNINNWYYCDCDDETHYSDQQCSLISTESAARKRFGLDQNIKSE